MRVIDACRCGRHHRNACTFVRCLYPNLREVNGRGFLAVVTTCDDVTVALFERIRPARLHLSELNLFRCSRGCTREHFLAAIDIDGPNDQEAA